MVASLSYENTSEPCVGHEETDVAFVNGCLDAVARLTRTLSAFCCECVLIALPFLSVFIRGSVQRVIALSGRYRVRLSLGPRGRVIPIWRSCLK